jgi:3-deoxy-D-manno-octulosonic-acid transferase
MFLLYRLLVGMVVWLVLVPTELVAMALGLSSLPRLLQRLGRLGRSREEGLRRPERLVLHAVSAGEMAAAEALLAHWSRPRSSVILTTCNRDGLAVAERIRDRRAEIEEVLFLPWDRPGAMRRWLRVLSPEVVVIVETEIWPGLFAACRELCLPLAVINGRIYPRDLKRYRMLPGFFRSVLSAATWIGTQDETERQRFIAIGAPADRVEVIGQLKYDGIAPLGPDGPDGPDELVRDCGVAARLTALKSTDRLLVGASTHRPEEALLLETLADLRSAGEVDLKLVLAPRNPRRARRLRRLTRARGLRHVLSSELWEDSVLAGWDVLILDRMGDLGAALDRADVVVIGGTFASVGSHNPLEAAVRSRAIVIGPHIFHFRAVIEDLAREGAISRLDSGRQLSSCLAELLGDAARRHELGRRARAVVEAGRGSAALYSRRLDELVSVSRAKVSFDQFSRPSGIHSVVPRSKA